MKLGLVQIFFFTVIIGFVVGGPEDYFSEDDAKLLIEQTRGKFDSNGAVNNQLKDTYFAVDLLSRLGSKAPNPAVTCQFAKDSVADNIESVFYSVNIRETLSCGETASGKVLNTITGALNSQNLVDLVHLVGAVATLKANKHIDVAAKKLSGVQDTILDLVDSESGTWFGDKKQEEGSPYFAGLALTALSQLVTLIGDDADVSSGVEAAIVLLDNGIEDDSRLFFRHTDNSVNSLKTTAVVAKGLADIQKVDQSDINDQINLIAGFLISQKYVSSLEDEHSLIVGLSAVNSQVFQRPLVITLVNNQIYATKEKDRESNVLVKITDVFGKSTVPVKVYLARAFRSGREDVALLSNQELTSVEKNTFSFDFLAARPDPGTYNLEFRVVPQEKTKEFQSVSSAVRRLQVVAAIGLSDGVLEISEQSGSSASHNFQQGQTIKQDITIKGPQSLSLTFKLKNLVNSRSVVAHQVFAKFTHRTTKQSKYFIIPHSGQGYEIKLSNSKIGKKLNYASGSYDVELFVGDSFVSSSFRWVVAKVDFTFDSQPVVRDIHSFYAVLPEIHHVFRPAANLAPEVLTYLFIVLVSIPFAFFILSVLRLGGIFNNIPTGFTFISAAIFVGGIGTLLSLIVLYWFSLKLFTALTYGIIISVPTIYFGKEVLKYNAQLRIKKKTQ